MASLGASRLKKQLAKMPEEFFETLTFGELRVGQRFIVFPLPGDNSGHGGFKRAKYIFRKTIHETSGFAIPTGEATNNMDVTSSCPHSMSVILVE